mmetsp:Transcript_41935/g.164327  ORF Transcript_41935/g.164327 Transcript_41935/m.164327 type:complete len:93 (+) Transcript_41935:214-492(+)
MDMQYQKLREFFLVLEDEKPLNTSDISFGSHEGNWCQFGCFISFGHVEVVGVPLRLKIRRSCSISLSPMNTGVPVIISARMHPTLQISTAVE